MANLPILTDTKDNATGQLSSGIAANTLTIPLQSGQGANFPQPYNGAATSLGTSSTLNCTGISALIGGSAAIGKPIRNVTDGSWTFIRSVSTNSIGTDALQGGSDNTWQNADKWRIGEFIITIETHDAATPYNVTAREKVLVYGRSTDNLLVESTSDRGFDGSTAQSWLTGAYVYLHTVSYTVRKIIEQLSELARLNDANITSITNLNKSAPYYAADSGTTNAFAVTLSPAPTAYSAGMVVRCKAANAITGAATMNVNGLGAVSIKKKDGATALASADIASGQGFELMYDGTNFQLLSPVSNVPVTYYTTKQLFTADSNQAGQSSAAEVDVNQSHTISSSTLAVGEQYELFATGFFRGEAGNSTIRLKLSSTTLTSIAIGLGADGHMRLHGGFTVQSLGVSGTVEPFLEFEMYDGTTWTKKISMNLGTVTVDTTASLDFKVSNQAAGSDSRNGLKFKTCRIGKYNT